MEFNGVTVAGSLVSGPIATTLYSFALGTGTGSDTITFAGRDDPSFNTLDQVSVTQSAVPETATWAMMLVGMGTIGFAMRRRQNVSVTYA